MISIYISKSDSTLAVDWDSMPAAAQRHIIEYGLRQKLNDAGSSATTKELGAAEAGKQAYSMAENVLTALMRGEVTVRTARTKADHWFTRAIREAFKKHVGSKLDEMPDSSNEFLINALATKLGKPAELLEAALQKRGEVLKQQDDAIRAIKNAPMDIDL